jgi:hypothetical protein
MDRSAAAVAGGWLSVLLSVAAAAQVPPLPVQVRALHIAGAREIPSQTIQDVLRIKIGEPLVATPEQIAETVAR